MITWSVDDADSNQVSTGMDEQTARRLAQEHADKTGLPTMLYSSDPDAEWEQFDPSSEALGEPDDDGGAQ